MTIAIKAPVFPESIADGVVATWRKKVGDFVVRDEVLAEIETDKVILEVPAPQDGYLIKIAKARGDTVLSAETMAIFEASNKKTNDGDASPVEHVSTNEPSTPTTAAESESEGRSAPMSTSAPATAAYSVSDLPEQSPAVRKALEEKKLSAESIVGSGKGDRITKEDVVNAPVVGTALTQSTQAVSTHSPEHQAISTAVGQRVEKRVPMTRLRAKVAERLLNATQSTAMRTTFNEVNMKPIMDMRKAYGDRFEKRHGTRLGFMSFFVKAATEALKRFPQINASLDGTDIVYHGYHDIGVAVSSDRGLVVPIIRDSEQMDFAEIEKQIVEYGVKAKDGKLTIDDMTGGTFTISNGGVFGSLMSTPILNSPQTAILGMHKIQERPMAVDGQVIILPMMYLALSYDHRMIDGKEAVQFLVTIKNLVEDPAMLLLDL